MKQDENGPLQPQIRKGEQEPQEDSYQPIEISTDRGVVVCRYYETSEAKAAAMWVGGVGGDWDTPAKGLYPRLCQELQRDGIASLRVRFRNPKKLDEAVHDVLTGISYLEQRGISTFALVGHSFGGAVGIQAANLSTRVRTVVTLATQGYGTEAASRLGPRCSILLIHGTADRVLSPGNSKDAYSRASEPKRLMLCQNAGHGLDEAAEQIHDEVRAWIITELNSAVE